MLEKLQFHMEDYITHLRRKQTNKNEAINVRKYIIEHFTTIFITREVAICCYCCMKLLLIVNIFMLATT